MLRPRRYASDVAVELVEGLRDGSISLEKQPDSLRIRPIVQLKRSTGLGNPATAANLVWRAVLEVLVSLHKSGR